MIPKNNRIYINDYFHKNQEFNEGDILEFEMPSFCSGTYETKIYLDNDGDPYIDKFESYINGCRDLFIQTK